MTIKVQRRLKRDILGVESVDGKPTAVIVPPEAIIEELSEPRGTDRIEILWNGRVLSVFVEDVRERGEEVYVDGRPDSEPSVA